MFFIIIRRQHSVILVQDRQAIPRLVKLPPLQVLHFINPHTHYLLVKYGDSCTLSISSNVHKMTSNKLRRVDATSCIQLMYFNLVIKHCPRIIQYMYGLKGNFRNNALTKAYQSKWWLCCPWCGHKGHFLSPPWFVCMHFCFLPHRFLWTYVFCPWYIRIMAQPYINIVCEYL